MSGRYWSVIGCCLALASYPVFGQEGPFSSGPQVEIQISSQPQGEYRPPFPVLVVEAPDQAEHASEREAKSDEHEADDLAAQQKAADAAAVSAASGQRQVDIAWWQLGLGGLGTLALLYSIYLNRKATGAAVEAANAARDAIGAERAWLMFQGLGFRPHQGLQMDGVVYPVATEIEPTFVNNGRTPALSVRLYREVRVIGLQDPIPTFVAPPHDISGTVVGPTWSNTCNPYFLVEGEYAGIKAKTAVAVVYCRATYFDAFQPTVERVTEATGSVRYVGLLVDQAGKPTERFVTTMVGPQNIAT